MAAKNNTLESELRKKGAGKQMINFIESVIMDSETDEIIKKHILRLVKASLDAENESKARKLLGRIDV